VSPPLALRKAARVVLLDTDDRVLLVRWRFEDLDGTKDVWGTPGGGIDEGEAPVDAVRRELLEETGLAVEDCGPCVGHRRHVLPMRSTDGTLWDGQEEWFYLVRTRPFEPRGQLSDEQLRAESLHEVRWCALDELDTLAQAPGSTTVPGTLADFVRRLAAEGPPAAPVELGV
jgi:8-oxo-dGTP diphosphatase